MSFFLFWYNCKIKHEIIVALLDTVQKAYFKNKIWFWIMFLLSFKCRGLFGWETKYMMILHAGNRLFDWLHQDLSTPMSSLTTVHSSIYIFFFPYILPLPNQGAYIYEQRRWHRICQPTNSPFEILHKQMSNFHEPSIYHQTLSLSLSTNM